MEVLSRTTLTFRAALALILFFGLFSRIARLDIPSSPFFDEGLFYLPAARDYLAGFPDSNFEHPPLGKLLIAKSMWLFGDNPWGWRLASALTGTVGVALTYRLGALLWGRREIGLLAAAFLSLDFLWLSFSRLAMLDIFQATLILAALLAAWSYRSSGTLGSVLLAGGLLGLAAGVKWSAAWALLPLALALLPRSANEAPQRTIRRAAFFLLAAFCAYTATWLYHVLALGYGLGDVVDLHLRMLGYQVQVGADRGAIEDNLRAPLSWLFGAPLMFTAREDRSVQVLITSNPLLLWPGLFAMLWLLRRGYRYPHSPELFVSLAFLALYLPWFLLPRLKYFYYLLPAMPLLAIGVAAGYVRLWRWGQMLTVRRRRLARLGLLACLALGAALFVAAYPAIAGYWRRG